jgi:hypothetical protein
VAFCKSCGARFDWYRTAKGASMPVEPEPHPDGTVKIDVVNNTCTVVPAQTESPLYVCHFVTCPGAGKHRR